MRPTSARTAAALFSILCSASLEEADFLDIFAGTGAIAVSAIKRGARSVLCVESDSVRSDSIAVRFASSCLDISRAKCLCADARRAIPHLARNGRKFGVVFADPPYCSGWGKLLPELMEHSWNIVAPGGVFVFERSAREAPAEMPVPRDDRIYGETVLSFYWKK